MLIQKFNQGITELFQQNFIKFVSLVNILAKLLYHPQKGILILIFSYNSFYISCKGDVNLLV